jgi:predicted nucleic acid-binding protein
LIAIVDAGPLYAALDVNDHDHRRCLDVLQRPDLDLIIPTLVVTEVCYFAAKNLGADVEAEFLRGLQSTSVETPESEEWMLIADLVERYSDFPLGATDASVAVLAERLGTELIITLDRRHFAALRTSTGRPFVLLPD